MENTCKKWENSCSFIRYGNSLHFRLDLLVGVWICWALVFVVLHKAAGLQAASRGWIESFCKKVGRLSKLQQCNPGGWGGRDPSSFHMTENIRDIKTYGIQKAIFACDLHAEVTHCFWFNALNLFDLCIIKILQIVLQPDQFQEATEPLWLPCTSKQNSQFGSYNWSFSSFNSEAFIKCLQHMSYPLYP